MRTTVEIDADLDANIAQLEYIRGLPESPANLKEYNDLIEERDELIFELIEINLK